MLFKIWFSLISTVLVAALGILAFIFSVTNVLHWILLFILTIIIALTILVYLEKPQKEDSNIRKIYEEFIKAKDARIAELEQKSDVMFKTAMRREDMNIELTQLKRKLEGKQN